MLGEIATKPAFATADLRVAPASPGKATRLRALMRHPGASFYVNLEEAGLILGTVFTNAPRAAEALVEAGLAQALVTDGGNLAAEDTTGGIVTATPPKVAIARVTGAGDTFMAAHIAAQARGLTGQEALQSALNAAATYDSGEDPA